MGIAFTEEDVIVEQSTNAVQKVFENFATDMVYCASSVKTTSTNWVWDQGKNKGIIVEHAKVPFLPEVKSNQMRDYYQKRGRHLVDGEEENNTVDAIGEGVVLLFSIDEVSAAFLIVISHLVWRSRNHSLCDISVVGPVFTEQLLGSLLLPKREVEPCAASNALDVRVHLVEETGAAVSRGPAGKLFRNGFPVSHPGRLFARLAEEHGILCRRPCHHSFALVDSRRLTSRHVALLLCRNF